MTTFTKEHKLRLERATHNRFLDECVARLKKLDLPHPYPKDKKLYKEFTKAGYHNAKLYGLDDFPQNVYAYILAWHVSGEMFIQSDNGMQDFFVDEYVPSFAKFYKLREMIGFDNEDIEKQFEELEELI